MSGTSGLVVSYLGLGLLLVGVLLQAVVLVAELREARTHGGQRDRAAWTDPRVLAGVGLQVLGLACVLLGGAFA